MTKIQKPKQNRTLLLTIRESLIGYCNLEFIWNLMLGIWDLPTDTKTIRSKVNVVLSNSKIIRKDKKQWIST